MCKWAKKDSGTEMKVIATPAILGYDSLWSQLPAVLTFCFLSYEQR